MDDTSQDRLAAAQERSANERAILNLLRQEGPTPAAEIARRMDLSVQSASVITRKLEAEDLVQRGAPVRGGIGKPSRPISLNPNGAFSIGLRIGRRRSDLILIDFEGRVLDQRTATYAYPTPSLCLDLARTGLEAFGEILTPEQKERIAGIGIGMPFDLWSWLDLLDAPRPRCRPGATSRPRKPSPTRSGCPPSSAMTALSPATASIFSVPHGTCWISAISMSAPSWGRYRHRRAPLSRDARKCRGPRLAARAGGGRCHDTDGRVRLDP